MPYLIFIKCISENVYIFAHSSIQWCGFCPVLKIIHFKEDIYRLLGFIYVLLKDCNHKQIPKIPTYKTVIFI